MVGQVAVVVEPGAIMSRSSIRPVIRFAYSRRGDPFGLVLTVAKGQYFPNEGYQGRIENSDWVMDVPDDADSQPSQGARGETMVTENGVQAVMQIQERGIAMRPAEPLALTQGRLALDDEHPTAAW